TAQLLEKSRAEATGPRLIVGEKELSADSALAVDPEMAQVLEKELKKPGDVTTILEERERFSVFRLQSLTVNEWTVRAFQIAKRDFETWFEKVKAPKKAM